MNSVCITGRLTRDTELRSTQSGTVYCSFSVAVDRPAVKDKTDFINCIAWGPTAEFLCKYFHKGDGIEIQGVLTTRTYETQEGSKRTFVEVSCRQLSFPKGRRQNNGTNGGEEQAVFEGFQEIDDIEDIPF